MNALITPAEILKAYNAAKRSRRFDPGRLNKALGLAQRRTTVLLADGRLDITASHVEDGFWLADYRKPCQCEDYLWHMRPDHDGNRPARLWVCKHRLASMLVAKAFSYLEVKQ